MSARALDAMALAAVPILVLSLFRRRWFCRHACPVGLLQEMCGRLRPVGLGTRLNLGSMGDWLVGLTLGGAVLGYPLFLWLDPLALFNGFVNAWRPPIALATLVAGLGLPLLLLLEFLAPRAWCQRLCPLGASQDLLAQLRRQVRAWLRREKAGRVGGGGGGRPGRRWFLGALVGAAGALALKTVHGRTAAPLRPPGAIEEGGFTGVCVRCGNCAGVCPSRVVQPDLGGSGVAGLLTPRLSFEADYCREDCCRCGAACPSGAIAELALIEKQQRVIGTARLEENLCLMVRGRECSACLRACPYQAIVLDSAADPFSPRPRVDPARCNGCGACEAACPTRPVRALRVHGHSAGTP